MKRALIAVIGLTSIVTVYGQGQLNFVNNQSGVFTAKVYDLQNRANLGDPANLVQLTGNPATGLPVGTTVYTGAALGAGFTTGLWAGPQGTAANLLTLTQVGGVDFTTSFRTSSLAANGLVVVQAVATSVAGGGTATLQMRAWDNRGGTITSWADVIKPVNDGVARGVSALFDVSGLAAPGGSTPPFPTGLRSFNLVVVPEPSAIALGVLGVGALVLFRRRKN